MSAATDASLAPDLHLRYQLHVDLVDAITERDPPALELIRAHDTNAPAGSDS